MTLTRWGFAGQLCAAANVQHFIYAETPWDALAWFIVVSGVLLIVGCFVFGGMPEAHARWGSPEGNDQP